jgi:hypothetical protein
MKEVTDLYYENDNSLKNENIRRDSKMATRGRK